MGLIRSSSSILLLFSERDLHETETEVEVHISDFP